MPIRRHTVPMPRRRPGERRSRVRMSRPGSFPEPLAITDTVPPSTTCRGTGPAATRSTARPDRGGRSPPRDRVLEYVDGVDVRAWSIGQTCLIICLSVRSTAVPANILAVHHLEPIPAYIDRTATGSGRRRTPTASAARSCRSGSMSFLGLLLSHVHASSSSTTATRQALASADRQPSAGSASCWVAKFFVLDKFIVRRRPPRRSRSTSTTALAEVGSGRRTAPGACLARLRTPARRRRLAGRPAPRLVAAIGMADVGRCSPPRLGRCCVLDRIRASAATTPATDRGDGLDRRDVSPGWCRGPGRRGGGRASAVGSVGERRRRAGP